MIDGIAIRPAVEADNQALLALTKLTPMAGRIALRIDRDPDFFALPRARGESKFFVATFEQRVIGCISVSTHDAYILGKIERIAHGNDLKVHPEFAGKRLSLRLLQAGEIYLREQNIDFSMSLFAQGNQRVEKLAEGKHGQPISLPLGRFFVDQLIPSTFRAKPGDYSVEEAQPEDLPAIASMVDASHRTKNFAPPITVADIRKQSGRFKKVLVARKAGKLVATLTIEDTQNLRQNVLIGAPATIRFALALVRLATMFVPKLGVPRLNQPLRILYVRFMACTEIDALKPLIAHARREAFEQGFTFLAVGLHELDPLRAAVTGIPKLTFISIAIATSLFTPERVKTLFDQVVYEDFALV